MSVLLLRCCCVLGCLGLAGALAAPVEFTFVADGSAGDPGPFAREVWATVTKPSGATVRAPAFYAGAGRFAVRILGDEAGRYALAGVEETRDGRVLGLPFAEVAPSHHDVAKPARAAFVRIDSSRPRGFACADGTPYVPLGGNIPWAPSPGAVVPHYREQFRLFSGAGLNWARIWMVNFGGTNLDWLPEGPAASPEPGSLDQAVARRWDEIVEAADTSGVRFQMVLQHHGQYSTETNPQWQDNPWNAVHRHGFLARPADFFTSAKARRLTRQKYRYIVARWGWSPAILAWELFNEVHWVDALRFARDEKGVAAWHAEMAEFIRSVDVHRHLVTTSHDVLGSPIYDRMDFLQPHLYAVNQVDNIRYVDPAAQRLAKPVFYGEFGHDHMPLSAEQKKSAVHVAPIVWAGLMGRVQLPAQAWDMGQLVEAGRFEELAAVARFLAATRIAEQAGLQPFSPVLSSAERMPLAITPGYVWFNRPDPEIAVPLDGSAPETLALVPGVLVSDAVGRSMGFAQSVRFTVDFPRADRGRLRFGLNAGATIGTTVEVLVDGRRAGLHHWPGAGKPSGAIIPADLTVEVPAGRHVVEVTNATGGDWVHFDGWQTGFDQPLLAAAGRRAGDFIAIWIWHRSQVIALDAVAEATGTLHLEQVPAGAWAAEWWDSIRGQAEATSMLSHSGGVLRIEIPPTARHRALVLRRAGQ